MGLSYAEQGILELEFARGHFSGAHVAPSGVRPWSKFIRVSAITSRRIAFSTGSQFTSLPAARIRWSSFSS